MLDNELSHSIKGKVTFRKSKRIPVSSYLSSFMVNLPSDYCEKKMPSEYSEKSQSVDVA